MPESFKEARADLMVDPEGDTIVVLKVWTADGLGHLHDHVTWRTDSLGDGVCLRIYDATHGHTIVLYAPEQWISAEVLRFYRRGDDPPEVET